MNAAVLCALALFAGNVTEVEIEPQRRGRNPLKVGDVAPKFKLDILKTDKKFELASNFGKRPTVLIFGSYT